MTRLITIFCFAFAALLTSSVNAQFADDFDSYGTPFDVQGTNGWKGWDNTPAASASTTDAQALSAPNSIAITSTSDLINELGGPITSGRWIMTVDQFVPLNHNGNTYFIILNTYNDGAAGAKNWSVELQFFGDGMGGTIMVDDFQFPDVPNKGDGWEGQAIIVDQWVQIKVCIDLDLDTVSQYYDGVLIPNTVGATGEGGQQWSERGSGGGAVAIGALDLFGFPGDLMTPPTDTIFYDNVELKQVVLGDANDDGDFDNTDIASFVLALTSLPAYQAMFPDVDPDCVLDMNGDGVFDNTDIADFVAALTG